MRTRFDATRRQHPRIEIDDPAKGHELTQGLRVMLRDISEGGFQTEAEQVPMIGDLHVFRVRLKSGGICVLRATAVHCKVLAWPASNCLVGWCLEGGAACAMNIRLLIEDVTTVPPGVLTTAIPEPVWAFQMRAHGRTGRGSPPA